MSCPIQRLPASYAPMSTSMPADRVAAVAVERQRLREIPVVVEVGRVLRQFSDVACVDAGRARTQTQVVVLRARQPIGAVRICEQRVCIDIAEAEPSAPHVAIGDRDEDACLARDFVSVVPQNAVGDVQFAVGVVA